MTASVLMYATAYCPYCIRARALLKSKGVQWEEIDVGAAPQRRQEMARKAGGRSTVPQIWIGDRHVGGCNELYTLEQHGELDRLLSGPEASQGGSK